MKSSAMDTRRTLPFTLGFLTSPGIQVRGDGFLFSVNNRAISHYVSSKEKALRRGLGLVFHQFLIDQPAIFCGHGLEIAAEQPLQIPFVLAGFLGILDQFFSDLCKGFHGFPLDLRIPKEIPPQTCSELSFDKRH